MVGVEKAKNSLLDNILALITKFEYEKDEIIKEDYLYGMKQSLKILEDVHRAYLNLNIEALNEMNQNQKLEEELRKDKNYNAKILTIYVNLTKNR